jgi:hypothetical protein
MKSRMFLNFHGSNGNLSINNSGSNNLDGSPQSCDNDMTGGFMNNNFGSGNLHGRESIYARMKEPDGEVKGFNSASR